MEEKPLRPISMRLPAHHKKKKRKNVRCSALRSHAQGDMVNVVFAERCLEKGEAIFVEYPNLTVRHCQHKIVELRSGISSLVVILVTSAMPPLYFPQEGADV